ncbi:hypothetical protein [Polaromonas sp.]|uniref:hypothetical protein n=1 Tax=Polaromonas sp. TaxID=1869339 RepID=UPI00352ADD1E
MFKVAALIVAIVSGTAVLTLVGAVVVGRRLSGEEIAVTFLGMALTLACWVVAQRRHARKRLRNLRDSALW